LAGRREYRSEARLRKKIEGRLLPEKKPMPREGTWQEGQKEDQGTKLNCLR